MTVAIMDVCQAAGLAPILERAGQGQRAFGIQVAGSDVIVWEGVDQVGRRMALMQGTIRHPGSIAAVEMTLPAVVESHQQGVALLAYYLAPHWGDEPRPQWARAGEQWADHLPWQRDQAHYASRSHALVRRDRIRSELQALTKLAEMAGPDGLATFAFDGEILRVSAESFKIAVMAEGEPWLQRAQVPLALLCRLPKRIIHDPFPIDIWDGHLRLGTLRVPLIENQNGDHPE